MSEFEAATELPTAPARRAFVAATAGAALVAAWVVPGSKPGAGIPILALVSGAAVHAARPRPISRTSWLFAAMGGALAVTAMLRAAEWVLAVNVLAALALAGFAATGATTWREMLWTPFAVLARVPQVPGYLRSGLRRPAAAPSGRLAPVLRGLAIAAGLLVVFGVLFASADPAFASLAGRLLIPDWDLDLMPLRVFVFAFAALAVGTLGLARLRSEAGWTPSLRGMFSAGGAPWRLGRTEWTIALGALDLLFAIFVGIQIAVLFAGHDHVLRTEGLTYAEYTRQGFFQLLAVGVLTLGVLAVVGSRGEREGARDVRRLRLLGGTLCALTLVVLASAMHRLGLYEDAFGFTQARLTVQAVLWWLGAVFLLVVAAGATWRGAWLPRATVTLTAAGLLAFALANPDAMVASRNVERFEGTGSLDLDYLGASMSADAVPALMRLPEPYRACALAPIAARLGETESWMEFNLGRSRARMLLDEAPPAVPEACPTGEGT